MRHRVRPTWQEEFAETDHSRFPGEHAQIRDPSWTTYEDAKKWALQMQEAISRLRRALAELASHQQASGELINTMSRFASTILENTQHEAGEAEKIPRTLIDLAAPYDAFVRVPGGWRASYVGRRGTWRRTGRRSSFSCG